MLIDLALHTGAAEVVSRILDERGLTFFLRGAGTPPLALDEGRVEIAVDLAVRQLPHEPLPEARQDCIASVRRRLIALVADAMVQFGY